MELPLGLIAEGFDGATAWSKSPMMRPRVNEDREKANAVVSAIFNADARWREQFTDVETLGLESVDGRPCYRILAAGRGASSQTRYYDRDTGRLVKLSLVAPTIDKVEYNAVLPPERFALPPDIQALIGK